MTLNGVLAGLVGITAGTDAVSAGGAVIIGAVCGVVVVYGSEFIDKVLKVDDPVGAVAAHGLCGAAGTILVGVFSLEEGLFYGKGAHLLGVQVLGVIAVAAWTLLTTFILFKAIKATVGLRVSRDEELAGLDMQEHGISCYPDFKLVSEDKSEDENDTIAS
jgi:ammonium transporter, Amt family